MFPGPLGHSLIGRALERGLWTLEAINFRDFAHDKHRSVDATPAGGGPGLVMRADIAAAAVDAARARTAARLGDDAAARTPVVAPSPRGAPFDQGLARAFADGPGLILLCGRFEGIDQRAIAARGVREVSVGDAVLTGGELPAMAMLDATLRLLPGVIGDPTSLTQESFSPGLDGLLEHPQYTRPSLWEGRAIPEVLLSGDHAKIAAWRRAESEAITRRRRPDLWDAFEKRRRWPEQSGGDDTGDKPNNG